MNHEKFPSGASFEKMKRWLVFIMIFLLTNPDKEINRWILRYQDSKRQEEKARIEILQEFLLDIRGAKNQEEFQKYVLYIDQEGLIPDMLVLNIENYDLLQNHINDSIEYMKGILEYVQNKKETLKTLHDKLLKKYPKDSQRIEILIKSLQ
ncbi:MAG: hypothetical protein AAB873_03230 [Patescibacteria group bacterium]